jgi:hypothetical protein
MQKWVRFSINLTVFEAENDATKKKKKQIKLTFVQILKHEIENKSLTIGLKTHDVFFPSNFVM